MRHNYPVRRTDFLSQYWLKIGYLAWRGYLNSDRGLVVISSEIDLLDNTDVSDRDLPSPELNFRYLDRSRLTSYLQEWLVPSQSIEQISRAVADYQPHSESILAIQQRRRYANESAPHLDIVWCQRLKLSPPDCYAQFQRRSSEFEL